MSEHFTFKTRGEFIEFKRNNPNIIVKFTATWCGPCKRIAPYFTAYYEQVKEFFKLVIVDYDESKDICSAMKVRNFPTFYSFVNGEVCQILEGADERLLKNFFVKTIEHLKGN